MYEFVTFCCCFHVCYFALVLLRCYTIHTLSLSWKIGTMMFTHKLIDITGSGLIGFILILLFFLFFLFVFFSFFTTHLLCLFLCTVEAERIHM